MSEQLSLFSMTTGMVESPAQADTSARAAEQMIGLTGKLRLTVLLEIALMGGITDEEGIEGTGLPASTYRPRRVELHKGWRDFDGGYIYDSGERRKTRSGRMAIVWRATEKGRAAIA